MITKKVVLVGDFATGKTSLIRRYVDTECGRIKSGYTVDDLGH